jgi:3-isopropylmalate dehydratase small subunit
MSRGPIAGRVWRFGDNVDTDQMAPLAAMALPIEECRLQLFPDKPEFGRAMSAGDIIVAGDNWGCGSSREQAPANLKEIGVAAIIARSFSRIFFRNSIAIGLIAIECAAIPADVVDGDALEVDVHSATVTKSATGERFDGRPYTPLMLDIIDRGGLLEVLADRLAVGQVVEDPVASRQRG